jgi:hypothetical protein
MTGLPQNVDDLLNRLTENSRNELSLVRTLADAIRRADDQLLRELRGLSLQHELRRESVLGELQTLSARLCALPAKSVPPISPRPTLEQHPVQRVADDIAQTNGSAIAHGMNGAGCGADWRQAAQNIEDDLDFILGPAPRH